jgi:hypothetical protein
VTGEPRQHPKTNGTFADIATAGTEAQSFHLAPPTLHAMDKGPTMTTLDLDHAKEKAHNFTFGSHCPVIQDLATLQHHPLQTSIDTDHHKREMGRHLSSHESNRDGVGHGNPNGEGASLPSSHERQKYVWTLPPPHMSTTYDLP